MAETLTLALTNEQRRFMHATVERHFLKLVGIYTTCDPESDSVPSSTRQLNALKYVRTIADGCGFVYEQDESCVYVRLLATNGVEAEGFNLFAHVDTSDEAPGENVVVVRHENYDGEDITYEAAPELLLSPDDFPRLLNHKGDTILTSDGTTLLGADDKSGVAGVLTLMEMYAKYPELRHGEILIVVTTDEEKGAGALRANRSKLFECGYTVDGGHFPEIGTESFYAMGGKITFCGQSAHPGEGGYGQLVNAFEWACRFVAMLPELDVPYHSQGREGFIYVQNFSESGAAKTVLNIILRDFVREGVEQRLRLLEWTAAEIQRIGPKGLGIQIDVKDQYPNMKESIYERPHVVELAQAALRSLGLEPETQFIRGGTDGGLLGMDGSFSTPNLPTGMECIHSEREWIALGDLLRIPEMLLALAVQWVNRGK